MRKLFIAVALCLCASIARAQGPQTGVTLRAQYSNGAPSPGCSPLQLDVDFSTGDLYDCVNGAWNLFSTGSGGSGVTSLNGLTGALTLYPGSGITIANNTPATGDIEISASGGSSAQPWSMLAPSSCCTPPTMSAFTGGNLTATNTSYSTTSGGAIALTATTGTGGDNVAWYYKAIPGGTWTATLAYIPTMLSSKWSIGGLCIRDSISGNLECAWIGNDAGNPVQYFPAQYNSYTSYASSPDNSDQGFIGPIVWEQLNYDGTHYNWEISNDGMTWTVVFSELPTRFLANAANQIGFGFDPITTSGGASMLVLDWSGI